MTLRHHHQLAYQLEKAAQELHQKAINQDKNERDALAAEVRRLRNIHIDSPMEELFTEGGMSDLRALANDMSDERLAWMAECFSELVKARANPTTIKRLVECVRKQLPNYTPAPATTGVVGVLLTRKDLEVMKSLVQNRMVTIRDESPDTETYLNKIGNIKPEGEGLLGIAGHLEELLSSPKATDRFWLRVDNAREALGEQRT